jgi:hypothetical protein
VNGKAERVLDGVKVGAEVWVTVGVSVAMLCVSWKICVASGVAVSVGVLLISGVGVSVLVAVARPGSIVLVGVRVTVGGAATVHVGWKVGKSDVVEVAVGDGRTAMGGSVAG